MTGRILVAIALLVAAVVAVASAVPTEPHMAGEFGVELDDWPLLPNLHGLKSEEEERVFYARVGTDGLLSRCVCPDFCSGFPFLLWGVGSGGWSLFDCGRGGRAGEAGKVFFFFFVVATMLGIGGKMCS